ncbi:MAG: glycosyltransferase family 2 protein [Lachnospiraceae bacterium]|nr:glycosyltransferase family 2 protein [Lachnospiraceae bacterium]
MPAYNEEENIGQVIADWYPVVEQIGGESRLVVLDDGSKDRTYSILKDACADHPLLIPVKKENQGHGATVLYGYRYALEQEPDYIFQTDSDGQTDPREFWEFWEQREAYDMVIGHRCRREDGRSRIFVTQVLKLVIRLCFHEDVTDANTPFRLMKAEVLREQIRLIPENFNLSNVILSVIYAKKGLRVKYIPITFRPRQGGENSINLKKIFGIGCQAVRDFWKINRMLPKDPAR